MSLKMRTGRSALGEFLDTAAKLDKIRAYASDESVALPEISGLTASARQMMESRLGRSVVTRWLYAMQPALELIDQFRLDQLERTRNIPPAETREAAEGAEYTLGSFVRFVNRESELVEEFAQNRSAG